MGSSCGTRLNQKLPDLCHKLIGIFTHSPKVLHATSHEFQNKMNNFPLPLRWRIMEEMTQLQIEAVVSEERNGNMCDELC